MLRAPGMYWGIAHAPSHGNMGPRQVPAAAHGLSTAATWERRPGSHLHPQPINHLLATQPNT